VRSITGRVITRILLTTSPFLGIHRVVDISVDGVNNPWTRAEPIFTTLQT
jgi:hypothetical protein